MPSTPFKGVRISWLMVARNWLFERVARLGAVLGALEFLFLVLAMRDVGVGPDRADREAVGVALDHLAAAQDPAPLAVVRAHPVLDAVLGHQALDDLPDRGGDQWAVVGVRDLRQLVRAS